LARRGISSLLKNAFIGLRDPFRRASVRPSNPLGPRALDVNSVET